MISSVFSPSSDAGPDHAFQGHLEHDVNRKLHNPALPVHDYRPALECAVSWLGDRYLLAEPVRRVVAILPRIEAGRGGRFERSSLYPVIREVADLYAAARGEEVEERIEEPRYTIEGEPGTGGTRKRRRRRRRPEAG